MSDIPYVAFGNNELAEKPLLHKGQSLPCLNCGKLCIIRCSTGEAGWETDLVQFITCDACDKSYLVGVGWKDIRKEKE